MKRIVSWGLIMKFKDKINERLAGGLLPGRENYDGKSYLDESKINKKKDESIFGTSASGHSYIIGQGFAWLPTITKDDGILWFDYYWEVNYEIPVGEVSGYKQYKVPFVRFENAKDYAELL